MILEYCTQQDRLTYNLRKRNTVKSTEHSLGLVNVKQALYKIAARDSAKGFLQYKFIVNSNNSLKSQNSVYLYYFNLTLFVFVSLSNTICIKHLYCLRKTDLPMYCYLHVHQHDTITVSYRSPSSLITDYRSWMLNAQYLKTSYLTL